MRVLIMCAMMGALALAGCTGSDDGPTTTGTPSPTDTGTASQTETTTTGTASNTTTSTTSETSTASPPRDPVTWDLTIQGNDFVDGSITIQVGDTVRWTHQDGTTPHTVTSDDGTTFDSGACPGISCMTHDVNGEFTHTFDTEGDFPYHCQVHPSMTDAITVLERFDGTP